MSGTLTSDDLGVPIGVYPETHAQLKVSCSPDDASG